MPLLGGDGRGHLNTARAFGELARGVIEALDRITPEIRSNKYPVIPLVGFRDVIRYFQDARPNDFRVEGGALIRRPAAGGVVLYQVFLDGKDDIVIDERGVPLGRAVRARAIDDELDSKFGRMDLIIFR
jgi:hypothetical protein